jgi:RNA polymerase sigma-70 factor (ECF subfamily)
MSELEDAIVEAWHQARAAWPDIQLELPAFTAHVQGLAGPDTRYPVDLYLAAACVAGDPVALEVFDRDVLANARGAIQAIDATHAFVDEAMQRMRASMLVGDGAGPRLAMYAGRGSLRAWVGVSAARTALMMRRSQKRAKEVLVDSDEWSGALAMISTNNPELELLKRQYAEVFGHALRDAVAGLEPRLRAVLRMSFQDALSIDEIGAVYAVHRATAARWIQRACEDVFTACRSLLAERLSLSGSELDRMASLVRSQLDVSLSQLLPASIE